MFNKLGIRGKLVLAFALTALIPAFVSGVSYFYSEKTVKAYKWISNVNFVNMEQMVHFVRSRAWIAEPVLTLVGGETTAEDANAAKGKIEDALKMFDEAAKVYEASEWGPGEEALWKEFKTNTWQPFVDLSFEMVRLSGTGNKDDQKNRDQLAGTKFAEANKKVMAGVSGLLEFQKNGEAAKKKEAEADAVQMNTVMLLTVAFGILICLAFGLLISGYLAKNLQQIANTLAKGAGSVSAASTQIASSSQELAQATTEQAASLQETAASVEELSSMVSKNSDSSKNAAESSANSQEKANEGKLVVEKMIASMSDIHTSNQAIMDQVNSSNAQLVEIVTVIKEIGDKTKVINDIVFQTKLLSFNASVEAARAGEQGKGFAVVAEEVGNLAQMSGNAAKEISDMLDNSIHKVESIVTKTKEQVESLIAQGKEKVDTGFEVANQCAVILDTIVENVSSVSLMAGEISNASNEQAHGIGEINKAMAQLNAVTQQNATSTHQTSQAAESLSAQAEFLNTSVHELETIIYGADSHRERATVAPKAFSNDHNHNKVVKVNFKKKTFDKAAPAANFESLSEVPHRDAVGFNE
ncbi:MAG: HAMP domain-containing methyl-accepting chemotaxis protein [Pseudobdellovibrionaceae bacterium]